MPVSGVVTIEGKPVKAGFIRVMPSNGKAASGKLGADGSFKLQTGKEDGTLVGEHPVEVIAFETKNKQKIWYAPISYSDYLKSKLTAKIDGPTNNLTFDLKWDSDENRAAGFFKEALVVE